MKIKHEESEHDKLERKLKIVTNIRKKEGKIKVESFQRMCKYCNIDFETREQLLDHIKTEHDQPGMNLTASQRTLPLPSPRFMAAMEKYSYAEDFVKKPQDEVKKVKFAEELQFNCDYCD